jgi:opacity protein-like surface antigen
MRPVRARFSRVGIGISGALLALSLFAIAPARAVELTPMVGYQWGGTLDYPSGSVHIDAAMSYGGSIGAMVQPGTFVEIGYMYQGSKLIGQPRTGPDFTFFDLGTHYLQLSGLRYLRESRVTPYIIGGMGMTVFDPLSSQYGDFDSQTLFSMSLGGGLHVDMGPRVALRLQSRLLIPINWASGGLYFGTGGGGISVSGGSAIAQGDATLGLALKLGQ